MPRITASCVALLLLLSSIAAGVAVGGAAATHGEEGDGKQLVEIQTFTAENTPTGKVEVELRYHIGRDIEGLEVFLPGDTVTDVVETDGFSETAEPNVYEWDERTQQPSLRVVAEVNESVSLRGELDAVSTANWTLTSRLQTGFSWLAENPEEVTWDRELRTGGSGVASDAMVYLGEYDRYTFGSSDERFQLVVSAATEREIAVNETRAALVTSSDQLSVGEKSEQVTVYVVPNPMRSGGRAIESDIWVHEKTVAPVRPTLFHEYVHTRQENSLDASARWTAEAEGEYYGYLLALQQGKIGYVEFHDRFEGADDRSEYSSVVLAEPDTWNNSTADYDYGGLVIARWDAQIRNASGGTGSYEDVLRAKNTHGGTVTLSDVERFATDAAGTDPNTPFTRYARSEPETVDVPSPRELTAPANDANLQVTVADATVNPGAETEITIEVANTGTDESVVPYVQLSGPSGVSQIEGARLRNREVVNHAQPETEGFFVLNHIEPGQRVSVDYRFVVGDAAPTGEQPIRVAVADISGNRATANATLEVVEAASPTGTPAPTPTTVDTEAASETTGTEMPGFGRVPTVLTVVTMSLLFARRFGD